MKDVAVRLLFFPFLVWASLRVRLSSRAVPFFCDKIATYRGDDPLEIWLKFIQWTQEAYKAGGPQAELIGLLERCTRELQGISKYKQDIRYLRVWIHYANLLPEPQDVFHFLKENDIGQDFALFYLAYATYLELRGNFSRADATFQAGLSRHAQPEAKLRAKCEEFQQRMARRIQRKAEEQALGLGGGPEPAARPALGALHADSRARRPASGIPRPLKRRPGLAVKETNTGRSGLEDEALLRDPLRLHKASQLQAKAEPKEAALSYQQQKKECMLRGNSPAWAVSQGRQGLTGLALPGLEPEGPEDVTMATKEAFAAVNSMFGGVMPCYGSGVYREVEPTVTISTKAAFEALNSMFSGSLPHEQQALRDAREAMHVTGQLPPRPHRPRPKGPATNQPGMENPHKSHVHPGMHCSPQPAGPLTAAGPASPALFGVYEDTGLLDAAGRAPDCDMLCKGTGPLLGAIHPAGRAHLIALWKR
ncbi:hypothetical protein WJX84_003204 [Apatococcus fuscideae]|uniref:BUB1 N-terminal domain-containing protein n=1 Tax=Apatococcus fuscideae TaxID=2026836 RepID=A0AAW1T919_9CHLO